MMKTMPWNVQRSKQLYMIMIVSLCVLGFIAESSFAAKKKSFRVGVLDPQAVIEKSKAGSRALAGLKEHAQARQTVMENDQKELEKLQAELEASKDKMSEKEQKN